MADINDAMSLYRQGRLNEAESKCEVILGREARHIDALKLSGWIKVQRRAPAEARGCFERIVAIEPNSVDALHNLAFVLMMLNQPAEALTLSDRALALAPDFAGAWVSRANALFAIQQLEDALASYDQALTFASDNVEALIGRGSTLAKLGRAAEAVATLGRIPVAHDPNTLYKRAALQQSLGLFGAAEHDYRRLTEISANALPAWLGLLACAMETCDFRGLVAPREKMLAALDAGQPVDPFLVLRVSSDPAQHLKCTKAAAPRAAPATPFAAPKGRPSRLRVAYVSPDFRVHPVAYLIAELLERHDRDRFEIIGISLGPPDGSDIRERVVKACDQFHDMSARSDDDVVDLSRRLNVDIAVDLAVYTEHARLGVLARRVAPVQASYLGYLGTSGSNFIDYLLCDRIVVPPAQQKFYTERLVYLPDSFMIADTTQPIADAVPSRSECGLPEQGFVFCCFNKNYKISQPVFEIWMRLLRSVEGSVLWLSANMERGCDQLRRHAEAQGVDPRRLVFAPGVAHRAQHFARHRLADLFLDTLPYNAHTTASDALFTGLPVLTVAGSTFVGRVATSMLHAIGLDELVARDLQEYERLALALARDPARLGALRTKLAANRRTQPLFDIDRSRRNVERAYDQMFDIYRRGDPPNHFSVAAE
ncbi:MAG: putative O-linked N-acetylglucosamine transferase, family [Xanthobacteraceae bacterium]|nr:putative O-linked N-acetylglucosamine transferase, family [Xanthobacteraceae bacterium]